jgi:cysteine synthase A
MSSEPIAFPAPPATEPRACIAARIDLLIGNTPLVRLQRVGEPDKAPIYVKLENMNPSGSIRDRYIAEILERAVEAGQTVAGDTIALAGLDDSGLAAALVGGLLGLKTQLFVPKGSSLRLLQLAERFNAQIIWTPEAAGLPGAARAAADWAREAPDRLYVDAFRRQAVQEAYAAIANEILLSLRGQPLGSFITSVTTGGTFREVSKRLREFHPALIVGGGVLLDIDTSSLVNHPNDLLQRFTMEQAWRWRDEIASQEGLVLSPKGAVGVALAIELQKTVSPEHIIVALNPDAGQRYLGWEQKPLFKHHWVQGI